MIGCWEAITGHNESCHGGRTRDDSQSCLLQGVILAWYGKANAAKGLGVDADIAAAVRAAVKPFIEWLQSAESEGDESESDDEYGPDLDED